MDPMTTTHAAAWALLLPELRAVTIDHWTDADLAEPGYRELAADLAAGAITPAVLEELEQRMGAEWLAGPMLTAAWTILAAHGRLERYNERATYSRRPKTRRLLGARFIVG
jgi:hypothetical protein